MTSKILKELRHPLFDDLEEHWSPYKLKHPPQQPVPGIVDQVPSLQLAVVGVPDGGRFPYIAGSREAALTIAPTVYGKACEAAAGALSAANAGKWLSGIGSYYLANYFMARSILCVFGLVPLSRDSHITLDMFPTPEGKPAIGAHALEIQLWKYGRWEHDNVWSLLGRVLNTLKAEKDFKEEFREFRRVHWEKIPSRRNRYSYADHFVSHISSDPAVSIPGDSICDFKTASPHLDFRMGFEEVGFYFALFDLLLSFHDKITEKANIASHYEPFCTEGRRSLIAA